MNIMQQIKPISKVDYKTEIHLEQAADTKLKKVSDAPIALIEPKVIKAIELQQVQPKVIQVKNLDSPESKVVENNFTILEFYPMCNLYIKHNSNLVKLDKKYLNHFSSELEQIHRENTLVLIHKQLKYLEKYESASFKLDVKVQGDIEKINVIFEGKLYFKNKQVFVPENFSNIIDYLVNSIALDIDEVVFTNIPQNSRKVFPTNKLELNKPNLEHCYKCEFNSTCNKQ